MTKSEVVKMRFKKKGRHYGPIIRMSRPRAFNRIGRYESKKATGMPKKVNVKLRYTYAYKPTNITTTLDTNVIRGNSIFDPEAAIGGGQPLAADQFSAFYNRYRVNGSSVKLHCVSNDSTVGSAPVVGLYPQVTNTSPADLQEAMQQDGCKYRVLGVAGGSSNAIIKAYRSTPRMLGINKQTARSKDSLSALVSADPDDQWYWRIFFQAANETTDTSGIIWVTVTYYVTFYDKVSLASS